MEKAVTIYIIIFMVIFIIGIISGIVAFKLVKNKKKPDTAIMLAIVCFFGISIPSHFIIAFSRLIDILVGVYCANIIIKAIKIKKRMP